MNDCPLYRAENIAWPQCHVFGELVPNPQLWVDHVTHDYTFSSLRARCKLPNIYITVTRGAPQMTSCALARVAEGHIDLPPGPVSQGLLLHEVAHLCAPAGAHHDRRYCATYLTLVRQWFGELAAVALRRAMRDQGIL